MAVGRNHRISTSLNTSTFFVKRNPNFSNRRMLAVLDSDIRVTKQVGGMFKGDTKSTPKTEEAAVGEELKYVLGAPVAYLSMSCSASKANPRRR
jgi:hypothetical protein